MENNIINIYKIKKNQGHIIELDNIILNKKVGHQTLTSSNKIYKYKNLLLCIDSQNKKKCFRYTSLESKVVNNFIVEKVNLLEIPLENFPFINKYDEIIDRNIKSFQDKNSKIDLIFDNSNNCNVSYISINSDTDIKKVLSFIE